MVHLKDVTSVNWTEIKLNFTDYKDYHYCTGPTPFPLVLGDFSCGFSGETRKRTSCQGSSVPRAVVPGPFAHKDSSAPTSLGIGRPSVGTTDVPPERRGGRGKLDGVGRDDPDNRPKPDPVLDTLWSLFPSATHHVLHGGPHSPCTGPSRIFVPHSCTHITHSPYNTTTTPLSVPSVATHTTREGSIDSRKGVTQVGREGYS